ncbi:rho guanine nucleotide exchange factor scd1 [Coprinopsis cinerea okayama7|uniref:Rho guanine nucleotide exchange factor scd1 n=1 Tax=Coprinopsis cinerea (strain Okayama-7 / 130 / ATCC MYA-4618 / FGSC 9003) TaxID=240176 RepID=D6RLF0_COPC7|nr:rho guanine nucleotide exchange factor scd1 [Coprinopsis cinerea okayama7\|eukprot:XP_002911728.1 rho guanine nucleotide exchange factor scd1 [Coprinopsis cinerea okayama7\
MASQAAARKKSIISSQNLQIETPVAGNTLLNKSASQATSLYQQCASLRSRLMRIRGFSYYFNLAAESTDDRQSTDPVTQLWDIFSLGISLCYIFDQLDQNFNKINNSQFNPEKYEANPDKERKHAIALFAMQVRNNQVMQAIPGLEPFAITDLWDRKSTDGLVKVINSVTAIVEYLPEDVFEQAPTSPPTLSAHESSDSLHHDSLPAGPAPPTNAREARRIHITREILETERKYVEGLEIMQKYATQLAQQNIIDQDTIHLLFPNLNNLLNFQRKFLIRFESTLEQPWSEQRWGQHFVDCEDEFAVYEPYCSNFTNATELLVANEQNLAALNGFISVSELKAFHITPIQRVCKYPLFFGDLIKVATGDDTYPHLEGLKQGAEAAHRITAKINEAHRRADNEQIVKSLAKRITDWKGHHLENFGELLLEDVFVVTKSDIDREYHVFLFEKIILCCKEALQQPPNGRGKNAKNNSILKKQPAPLPLATGGQSIAQRDTPLLLKGRIFLGNVTQALSVPARASTASGIPAHFPLQVWWKGDDDLEFFTLRCKREDQMRQWESTINRLIKEAAQRRASERPHGPISRVAHHSPIVRVPPTDPHSHFSSQGSVVSSSAYSSQASSAVSARSSSRSTAPYHYESSHTSYSSSGPQGYPPHEGFDRDDEEDDLEDYPPASTSYSGRGTPMGNRRPTALMNSNMSAASYASDASFGNSLPTGPKSSRPVLRSQFSSTRLKSAYEGGGGQSPGTAGPVNGVMANDYRNGRSPTPNGNAPGLPRAPPMNRSRSASQPSAYVPSKPMPAPRPLPTNSHWSNSPGGIPVNVKPNGKRGSGSSQSTGDSSDYSPNSSSPVTPFGSSESSLVGGVGLPGSRGKYDSGYMSGHHHPAAHQSYGSNEINGYHANGHGLHSVSSPMNAGPPIKVKVHFHEDIFVIQVPRSTEYEELVEKVGRKIRLCGPRRDDGPLKVKYKDEDGDYVSLGSTEDVQMAFEAWKPGGQVTLLVT